MNYIEIIFSACLVAGISFLAVYFTMPQYIRFLKGLGVSQTVSEYSLKEFQEKAKTPIMGGLLFVVIPCLLSLLLIGFQSSLFKKEMLVLFTFFSFGLIGFIDDFLIIKHQNNQGLNPRYKLVGQIIFSLIAAYFIGQILDFKVTIPFTSIVVDLGYGYFPLAVIMLAGESNAVNFTDGMDGLCAGCVSIVLTFIAVIALLQKELYLFLIIIAVIAALLAYLRYNFFPAKIFMGDTGSLALGALVAILMMVLKKELSLLVIGATFLWEILSVMIQVFSVKVFKKRVFLYTPIHYSFSKKGMPEKEVVLMFYGITLVLSAIGFVVALF